MRLVTGYQYFYVSLVFDEKKTEKKLSTILRAFVDVKPKFVYVIQFNITET